MLFCRFNNAKKNSRILATDIQLTRLFVELGRRIFFCSIVDSENGWKWEESGGVKYVCTQREYARQAVSEKRRGSAMAHAAAV